MKEFSWGLCPIYRPAPSSDVAFDGLVVPNPPTNSVRAVTGGFSMQIWACLGSGLRRKDDLGRTRKYDESDSREGA